MIAGRLSQLVPALDTRLVRGDADFCGLSTDTRTVKPGELFVALRGERYDAHEFLETARAAGAAAAVVERELVDVDLPQLVCLDTLDALGRIARWYRGHTHAHVLGITGSNGKTTVKTLAASILARAGRCHVNAGNLNNEIGLPLSLLRMPQDTDFAVLEMGAGKPGDIAYLAGIAQPEIGLVNNIAPAHLERMGSLDGVAETKGALYAALPAHGVAVINADCNYAARFAQMAGARRRLHFGLDHAAEIGARIKTLGECSRFELVTPLGARTIDLPLAGRHNVRNALAAAALALAAGAGLDAIAEGLMQVQGVSGRLTRHTLPGGALLIDDSYNANPGSVRAAIDTLALQAAPRWLVLGNMAELGPRAAALHGEVGEYARRGGIEHLLTVGALAAEAGAAFGAGAEHFADQGALVQRLREALLPGATVLIKGSRSSAMERVVQALAGKAGDSQHAA